MTELELRQEYALTAAKWCGVQEGSREHAAILQQYNSIEPLPRGYQMGLKDPWCAAFVSAAGWDAGIEHILPLECSCSRIIAKAKEMGIWVEDDSHVPGVGDWVLYNWQADASGDDTGAPDHIGVVMGVFDRIIVAVEGNFDNAVKLRRVPVDDKVIRGFVCPDFASLSEKGEERMKLYHTIEQVPEYAKETVGKLTADGSLLGVGKDDLGLSEDLIRILVILDRRGLL